MKTEKLIAKHYAETNRQIEQWKREALAHGGVLPAMWLDRGFVVRCNSWLDDRWGGGTTWEVVSIEFDNLCGDVQLGLLDVKNKSSTFDRPICQSDLVELLRPRICTPTQWRLRRG